MREIDQSRSDDETTASRIRRFAREILSSTRTTTVEHLPNSRAVLGGEFEYGRAFVLFSWR